MIFPALDRDLLNILGTLWLLNKSHNNPGKETVFMFRGVGIATKEVQSTMESFS